MGRRRRQKRFDEKDWGEMERGSLVRDDPMAPMTQWMGGIACAIFALSIFIGTNEKAKNIVRKIVRVQQRTESIVLSTNLRGLGEFRMPMDPINYVKDYPAKKWIRCRNGRKKCYRILSELGCRYRNYRGRLPPSPSSRTGRRIRRLCPRTLPRWKRVGDTIVRARSVPANSYHSAMDITAPPGWPQRASALGKVIKVVRNYGRSSCGKQVNISYFNGRLIAVYCHLQSIPSSITARMGYQTILKPGDILGYTGNTTGDGGRFSAHLHMQLILDGKTINPRLLLPFNMPEAVYGPGGDWVTYERAKAKQFENIPTLLPVARMLSSEFGASDPHRKRWGETTSSIVDRILVEAAFNRFYLRNAFSRKIKDLDRITMKRIILGENVQTYGSQGQGGRPFASSKVATFKGVALAEQILKGFLTPLTKKWGFVWSFTMTNAQKNLAQARVGNYTRTPRQDHRGKCSGRELYAIELDIPGYKLTKSDIRFYGRRNYLTKSGKAQLSKRDANGCKWAPKKGFSNPEKDLMFPDIYEAPQKYILHIKRR